jgi:DNA mismatch repair protein MutL
VEENDNLYFIDFHAAHERMLYNSILKNMEFDTEDLLFPLEIEMTSNDVNFVMQQRNFFAIMDLTLMNFPRARSL